MVAATDTDYEAFASSLERLETSQSLPAAEGYLGGHPMDLQSRFQAHAHRGTQGTRRHIVTAFWKSSDETHRKRAGRIAGCCAHPVWCDNAEGQIRPALRRCRDRLCPLCSERRGRQAAARCHGLVQRFDAPRFVTLTQMARVETLNEALDRICASFQELRRHKFWKNRVRGGVWALEVTHRPGPAEWHAHLHIITDGEFMPQQVLSDVWKSITGDSFIVHVKAVPDRERAARYIAAYVAKPLDVQRWPEAAIREFADAMRGRRLLQPFGVAMNADLGEDDEPEPPEGFEEIGPCSQLLDAEKMGSTAAAAAREILSRVGGDFCIATATEKSTNRPVIAPVEPWELAYARNVLRIIAIHGPACVHAIDAKAGLPGVTPPPCPSEHSTAIHGLFG
jgi:hypothetical protein